MALTTFAEPAAPVRLRLQHSRARETTAHPLLPVVTALLGNVHPAPFSPPTRRAPFRIAEDLLMLPITLNRTKAIRYSFGT